jgi:hypothetical protein
MKTRWLLIPNRSRSNPRPGQLSGKVENRRCKAHPSLIVRNSRQRSTPSKGAFRLLLSKDVVPLQIDDSALQGDRDRMRPVVCS